MVMKEIHNGCFIVQSYAAVTLQSSGWLHYSMWLKSRQKICSSVNVHITLRKPKSPRLVKTKDLCLYVLSLKVISCTRWE